MVILIRDVEDTPQRLPLQRLIDAIAGQTGASSCDVFRVHTGYGERIAALETRLDGVLSETMPVAVLRALAAGIDEWFFELDARFTGTAIRFGLFDSSLLFVDAPDDICAVVGGAFVDVEAAPQWRHRPIIFNGVVVEV